MVVTCPECGKRLKMRDGVRARKGRCTACGAVFPIPAAAPPPPPPDDAPVSKVDTTVVVPPAQPDRAMELRPREPSPAAEEPEKRERKGLAPIVRIPLLVLLLCLLVWGLNAVRLALSDRVRMRETEESCIQDYSVLAPDHIRITARRVILGRPQMFRKRKGQPDPKTIPTASYFLAKLDNVRDKDLTIDLQCGITTDKRRKPEPQGLRLWYCYRDPNSLDAFDWTAGSNWASIEATGDEIVDGEDKFRRFHHRFTTEPVWVSRALPYTCEYHRNLIEHLKAQNDPRLEILEIARTPGGRTIDLLRITDPASKTPENRRLGILAYGREHATEPMSSHTVAGMARYLLSGSEETSRMLQESVWLLIPMFDPDGSVDGTFDRLTNEFLPSTKRKEIFDVAGFFKKWVDLGMRLDIALDFHSFGSAKATNVVCAKYNPAHQKYWEEYHGRTLKPALSPLTVAENPWKKLPDAARLAGWCERHFGTFFMGYEVNEYHNRPQDLAAIGTAFVHAAWRFLHSDAGAELLARIDKTRAERVEGFKIYLARYPFVSESDVLTQEEQNTANIWARKRQAE